MAVIRHKEAIHSGQFMVSEFEADEEDIEDIPEVVGDISSANKEEGNGKLSKSSSGSEFIPPKNVNNWNDPNLKGGGQSFLHKDSLPPDEYLDRNERGKSVDSGRECSEYNSPRYFPIEAIRKKYERYPLLQVPKVQEHIEQTGADETVTTERVYINQNGGVIQRAIQSRRSSGFANLPLRELFSSMSVAYRQKLTSPKWNRFKGLKLRWKDKIRLNNVIWRCWHLQYKENRKKLLCAFANPLELENHKHTEAGPVVQGKYWKRKLDTIKIEYMRWRTWYHNDCNINENDNEIDGNALSTNKEKPSKENIGSNATIDRKRTISRCISESDGRVGTSATTDKLDLDKAISKDDWNLEQLLFDENFLAENFPTDMPTPVNCYDMGGDDYRNPTNSDFFIPGLPSLQPNLFDIGVVDFEGDLMFNSSTINPAPIPAQQNTSQAQKNVQPPRIAQKQMPSTSEKHQISTGTSSAFQTIHQNDISPKVVSTNVVTPQVTVVDHTQLVISKEISSRISSEMNLHMVQSPETFSGNRGTMENIRRQQQPEIFSDRDAKISPNLAAATASNLKITRQHNLNVAEPRNQLYNATIAPNEISSKSILGSQYSTSVNPSSLQLQNINKISDQREAMFLEQKIINHPQLQLPQNHVPQTIQQIVKFEEPKVNNVTTSVMTANFVPNVKIQNTIAASLPLVQTQNNLEQRRVEQNSMVDDNKESSRNSPLVQLLRTNNKRQLPIEAFEPNKKLLLSTSEMSQTTQSYDGIVQTPTTSVQILTSNDGRIVAFQDQQANHPEEYQDVFKLPLTRPGNEGKYMPLNMQSNDELRTKSTPLRSHNPELTNEQLKQVQYSIGQMDHQITNSERQTYLMQRPINMKQDENHLIKQEFLGRQLEQPTAADLELQNEINCRKLTQNERRKGMTTQRNLTMQNSSNIVNHLPPNIKTEIRDYSTSRATVQNAQPKYTNSYNQSRASFPSRETTSRPRLSNIPQPKASEIQQSQITLLRSVISANSNSAKELLGQPRDSFNNSLKNNLQNNLLEDGNVSAHQKQPRGGGRSNAVEQKNKHKRDVHINAEQNRRTSLKTGFDGLRQIIPGLNDSGK